MARIDRMRNRQLSGYAVRLLIAGVLLVSVAGYVRAQPSTTDEAVRKGLVALQRGSYDDAWNVFRTQLNEAAARNDDEWVAQLNFYLGLTRHRQATAPDGVGSDEARNWLLEAERHYREALRLKPDSSGGHNNLAQVYVLLDRADDAKANFRAAIELAGAGQANHLANFGDFLAQQGKYDDAKELYELARQRQPGHRRATAGIARCYQKQDPDSYGAYMWQLMRSGNVQKAIDLCLDAIAERGWKDEQYVEFITCVARSLSLRDVADASELPPALNELREHPVVGNAVKEIQRLFSGEHFRPAEYSWWRQQVTHEAVGNEPRGGWPQEAFTALINSRGDYFQRRKQIKQAERYYLLAYKLTPDHLDPLAMMKMAELWVKQDQVSELERFLTREEPRLIEQKGSAIADMSHKRAYEMHRGLALVYTHLGRWDKPDGFRNAKFQYQAALDKAADYNRSVANKQDAQMIFDTQLVTEFAQRLENKGEKASAFQLRVEQAKVFKDLGGKDAARDVILPIKDKLLPEGVPQRFDTTRGEINRAIAGLADNAEIRTPGAGTSKPARVKVNRITLWSAQDSRIDRRRLEEWARFLDQLVAAQATRKAVPTRVGLLPGNAPREIQRVAYDGRQGTLSIRNGRETTTLRFEISTTRGTRVPPFRYARPAAGG